MAYKIVVTKKVVKQIESIAEPTRSRIRAAIDELAKDPRPNGCLKLSGLEDEWRVRVGDYRIVYSIEDDVLTVEVVRVKHRREVY